MFSSTRALSCAVLRTGSWRLPSVARAVVAQPARVARLPRSAHAARPAVDRRTVSTTARRAVGSSSGEGGVPPDDERTRGRGPVTWAGLAALVVGGASLVGYFRYKREEEKKKVVGKVTSYGKPALGGPWELVNQHGVPVTDSTFRGGYVLLYFGFTYCPDICPNELVKMGRVVEVLDAKKNLPNVTPIMVTLDPNRDTVAQMKAYIQDFHPRMQALTGTPDQIARAAKRYRVYFSDVDREEDDDDYVVDHSIIMYFLGPDGDFLEFFTQQAEVDEIVDKMSFHMRTGSGTQ